MKHVLISFLLISACTEAFSQNLITVGILPDLNTDYSSIQAAIDAASPGDIIQITPGVYSETGVTIDKELYIQGSGFNIVGNFSTNGILTGSAFLNSAVSITADGSNSIIESLDIHRLDVTDAVDILIRRSRIRHATIANMAGEFQGCYMGGSQFSLEDAQFLLSGNINITYSNCLFPDVRSIASSGRASIFDPWIHQTTPSGQINFDRCIFRNLLHGTLSNVIVIVENSIFLTNDARIAATNGNGSIVVNSLFEIGASNDASATHNIFSINGANELNGYPNSTPSFDAQFMLSSSSQAIGYANDGGDCGIFGGLNPYILSGIPSIPFIYNFDANLQGSTGGGLDVNIQVRSQN